MVYVVCVDKPLFELRQEDGRGDSRTIGHPASLCLIEKLCGVRAPAILVGCHINPAAGARENGAAMSSDAAGSPKTLLGERSFASAPC